jgi:hypothetical protein
MKQLLAYVLIAGLISCTGTTPPAAGNKNPLPSWNEGRDRNSPVGRLGRGLDAAMENGWTLIDMQNDWKIIYPFEKPQ